MNLRVIREPSQQNTTLSVVFVDRRFFSFGLEDQIRERAGEPVSAWKVYGQTAIPAGRYRVVLTPSQRFGRVLPELLEVPGFTGIRIHPGNSEKDTSGCLLLGVQRANVRVLGSAKACDELDRLIRAALDRGEQIWIDIENPPAAGGPAEETR